MTVDEWIVSQVGKAPGYAIDVGANDGVFQSNTLAREHQGWKVLCVEANPAYEQSLRSCRALVEICACSNFIGEADFYINDAYPPAGSALVRNGPSYREIRVPVKTADWLLNHHQFPRLDLASIDVEHTELYVLQGLKLERERWRPRAIVVESLTRDYIPNPEEVEQGLVSYLLNLGYARDGRIDQDLLFVRTVQ